MDARKFRAKIMERINENKIMERKTSDVKHENLPAKLTD